LDTLKAIRELHRANIVHASLKPENVMINCDRRCVDIRLDKNAGEEECKLSDRQCVAVVVHVGSAVGVGKHDLIRGTPGFIPKETIDALTTGSTFLYEKSADIFALGAMLYELRTDSPLIPLGEGKYDWAINTKKYNPNSIAGVDSNLQDLISKMTQDAPTLRPSIESVVTNVDELLKESVSEEAYAKAVQDPDERGALQALPACLKI